MMRACRWGAMMLWSLVSAVAFAPTVCAQRGFTVVLDAGHGGKDPGAIGYGAREKDITLGVVRHLGRMIRNDHPEVKVLYTRDKDVFVGLQARADFANRHKASLFISVHVNSAGGSSARGTETYVLGISKHRNNLSVAMRENQAMLLEDDYKTRYQGFDPSNTESYIMFDLMQEAYLSRSIDMANYVERQYRRQGRHSRGVRQDGFWVLSQSAMPSILTEIGFISNPSDAAYLSSDDGQRETAQALARAFSKFYNGAEPSTPQSAPPTPAPTGEESLSPADESTVTSEVVESPKRTEQAKAPAEQKAKGVVYKVQFMSSPEQHDTEDRRFAKLGMPVSRVKEGRLYVYTVGDCKSLSEARRLRSRVARQYEDCFVVEYRSGKRVGRVR